MNKTCALAVLNYNGAELLRRCIPSLIEDAEIPNTGNEIVIIDNRSTDNSKEIVLKEFPTVKWFESSQNRYLISYNEFLKICPHKYVFLLNNDVMLRKGCIGKLLNVFDASDVFSVAPQVLNRGDIPENGRTRLYWSGGRFHYKIADFNKGMTAFPSTAAGMYDKEKLVSMGGIDDLLYPMYGEEMDLSLMAYRRGWKVIFEPSAIVDHIGGATINKKVKLVERRASLVKNRHLSMIKHTDNLILLKYIFINLIILPFRLITLDKGFLMGTKSAISYAKYAFERKKIEKKCAVISNKEVFNKLENL